MFHEVLDDFYTNKMDSAGTQAVVRKSVKDGIKDGQDAQEAESAGSTVLAMADGYATRWGKDDQARKWLALEEKFDVRFPHANGYRLRGKVDGVFETAKGKAWLLETKTASQIVEDTLSDSLAFDFQSLFYVMAMEIALKREIHGVLYNLARKPQLRRGKAESLDAFQQRIKADIALRPDFYFIRFEVAFPAEVRLRFHEDLQSKLAEFQVWCNSDTVMRTYRNESNCIKRWNCNYLPACGRGSMEGYAQTGTLFEELA